MVGDKAYDPAGLITGPLARKGFGDLTYQRFVIAELNGRAKVGVETARTLRRWNGAGQG